MCVCVCVRAQTLAKPTDSCEAEGACVVALHYLCVCIGGKKGDKVK